MEIRDALIADAPQLQSLLAQLGYALTLEQVEHKLTTYTQKDAHFVWVAHEGSHILGFITFILYECFLFEGGCVHIESLVVDTEQRGKGIGKKLMHAVEQYAITAGAVFSELITLESRRKDGTHGFYEKLGYKDGTSSGLTYFSKELTEKEKCA